MSTEDLYAKKLLKAIDDNKLTLPTQPEVALKIRETVNDSSVSLEVLGNVITGDAALTARLIRVANSPLMRSRSEITSVSMAINRLGLNFVRNLVTGLAMEQIFQATNEEVDTLMREVWARDTRMAGFAHAISAKYSNIPSEQGVLASLMHEIGALPILSYAEEHDEILEVNGGIERIIRRYHKKIGTAILKSWQFPQEIVSLPENYRNWSYEPRKKGEADLVDIVTVSYLFSLPEDHEDRERDWSTVKAFGRLKIDPEFNPKEDEKLWDNIQNAIAMLS